MWLIRMTSSHGIIKTCLYIDTIRENTSCFVGIHFFHTSRLSFLSKKIAYYAKRFLWAMHACYGTTNTWMNYVSDTKFGGRIYNTCQAELHIHRNFTDEIFDNCLFFLKIILVSFSCEGWNKLYTNTGTADSRRNRVIFSGATVNKTRSWETCKLLSYNKRDPQGGVL